MALARTLAAAVVCGLLTAADLGAQTPTGGGTISGRVVDSLSQQPISNATITIVGTTRGTFTRTDGGFTLAAVPAGEHTVRVARNDDRPLLFRPTFRD